MEAMGEAGTSREAVAIDEVDPFGTLDAPLQCSTYLTPLQYTKLVLHVGEKLRMENVAYRFNLPDVMESREVEENVLQHDRCEGIASRGGGSMDANLEGSVNWHNPPVCAHMVREEALRAMRDPRALPSVTCELQGDCSHGPPHVHCLFCLLEGGAPGAHQRMRRDVHAVDLRHGVLAHYTEHMQQRDAYLTVLEEEEVEEERMGSAASAKSSRLRALESLAEREGRHTCFVISAGGAGAPVIVAYCAACDQVAPLATFTEDETCLAGGTDEVWSGDGRTVPNIRSVETAELVLARILLASELLQRVKAERRCCRHTGISNVQEESYLFLATPFLFDSDREDLTEHLESGVIATHASAVLPLRVTASPPSTQRPCLSAEEDARIMTVLQGLPPYRFEEAIVGFVMQWPTAKDTCEKVTWALQQEPERYQFVARRRLVYVEDTDEWVIAHMLCRRGAQEEDDLIAAASGDEDGCGHVRVRHNCSIFKALPLTLVEQYASGTDSLSSYQEGGDSGSEVSEALGSCPYGMEARTIHYFSQMAVLAKAIGLAGAFAKAFPAK
ncbi:hypothetical protein ERJ75_001597200 [Trypanosoma vivax]|uniref:Uncharacterized protein n=1 Tax=Trypanosoma vivax (strain Y486) TaxID=1055687 RepID=G0TSH0_TRYVY|nr:hypothetical protein TRVL_03738 [Trypanosoma vivax]KAH8605433.1 hypothetical protein ERJ75_001597200 [Trypanosoma vivax]CCC46897.1 conserved hypothetical protein [Trypanosoma vivax Y486]